MALNVDRGMNHSNRNTSLQVRQIDPKAYQARDNYSAFVVLLTIMGMKRTAKSMGRSGFASGSRTINVENPKFEWFNRDTGTPLTEAVANSLANATTLTVTLGDGKMFTTNDLIYNRNTGEVMLVTDVTGDVLTVIRGWGTDTQGVTGEAITAADGIVHVAAAFPEGSRAPEAMNFKNELFFNYTQIFKQTIENSGTNEATKYFGNVNKMSDQQKDSFDDYLLKKSRAYFLGQRSMIVGSDGKVQRTTGGLDYYIKSNIMVKKAFGYNMFMDFAEKAYSYGGDEKIFICNPAMSTLIQKDVIAAKMASYELSPKEKEFGIHIKRLRTSSGVMDILVDHTMKDIYRYPTAFALETRFIEEMVLRPDTWKKNVQLPDEDSLKDLIIGETGLKVINEKRHAKLIIDPYAAD